MDSSDSKRLADSLDVDNMDANLFGAITKKKRSDSNLKPKVSNESKPAKGPVKDPTTKLADQEITAKSRKRALSQPPNETPSKPAVTDASVRKRSDKGKYL